MPLVVMNALRWIGAFTVGFFSNEVADFFGGLYDSFFPSDKPTPMIIGIALPLILGVVTVAILIWLLVRGLKKMV